MSFKWIAVLFFSVVFGFVTAALARLPGIDNSKAYTEAQYRQELYQFNKETLSGAYLRVGNVNPQWDKEAVQFLDDMAVRFSNAQHSTYGSRIQGQKPSDELIDEGSALLETGCDDPMVAYCLGVLLKDAGNMKAANGYFRIAGKGLIHSEYPVCRTLMGALRAATLPRLKGRANERKAEVKYFRDHIADIARGPDSKGIRRRILYDFASDMFDNALIDPIDVLNKMLKDDSCDKWLVNAILGRTHIAIGWQARGTGWASEVTAEGWKKFTEHLAAARDALEAAYKIEPAYPEPAAEMITVAMGASELNLNAREWFEKAVAAQLDCPEAYYCYCRSLMPRWGGSQADMFALAEECVEVDRYDTDLPYVFEQCLHQMLIDGDFYVSTPTVYSVAAPVFDKLIAVRPDRVDFYNTFKMLMEYRSRQYDKAKTSLHKLPDGLNIQLCSEFHVAPLDAIGKISAMTGPQGKKMQAIEARYLHGDTKNLIADLHAVAVALNDMNSEDPGAIFVRNKIKTLEFARDFAKGDWVSVQPDRDLSGWMPDVGKWSVDKDGRLVGVSQADGDAINKWVNGPSIAFSGEVGERYSVRGHVSGDANLMGFMLFGSPPPEWNYGAWTIDDGHAVAVGTSWNKKNHDIRFDDKGHDFLIEVWDRTVSVKVDDDYLVKNQPVEVMVGPRLSVSALYAKKGTAIVVSGLEVKHLEEQPR